MHRKKIIKLKIKRTYLKRIEDVENVDHFESNMRASRVEKVGFIGSASSSQCHFSHKREDRTRMSPQRFSDLQFLKNCESNE